MWRDWTSNDLVSVPIHLKGLGVVGAVLGLAAVTGSGQLPIPDRLVLTALVGSLLLSFVMQRMELGLIAVLLSFLVGFSVFSTGSLDLSVTFLLVVMLVGVWLLRRIGQMQLQIDAPGLQPLVFWIIVSVVSVLYSYFAWDMRVRGIGQSWADGHRWIGYQLSALAGPAFTTGVYVLTVNGIRSRRWLGILWVVAIGILLYLSVPSALGFLRHPFVPWQGLLAELDRSGTAGVPEMYLAVLTLGLFLFETDARRRVLYAALFALGSLGVFAAYYLNTWLGLLGGCLIVIWQRSRRLFVLSVAALVLCGLILMPIIDAIINHRVTSSGDPLRLIIWDTALDIWLLNPVLGVGPGNLPSYMLAFSPLPWNWVQDGMFDPHNVYLTILGETGIVGLICVLWFIASYLKTLSGWTWKCGDDLLAGISAGGMGLFVANMITATVASGLFAVSSGALFNVSGYAFNWVMFGAAIAAMRIAQNPTASSTTP